MRQLPRLSPFQVSVGMAAVMRRGTLNRVMIVETGLPAALMTATIALPVLVAPLRARLGFRSDTHASALEWRRLPHLRFGALWQLGGRAVMPFALLVLSGYDRIHVPCASEAFAAPAFVTTGLDMHMTQTAGPARWRRRAGSRGRAGARAGRPRDRLLGRLSRRDRPSLPHPPGPGHLWCGEPTDRPTRPRGRPGSAAFFDHFDLASRTVRLLLGFFAQLIFDRPDGDHARRPPAEERRRRAGAEPGPVPAARSATTFVLSRGRGMVTMPGFDAEGRKIAV